MLREYTKEELAELSVEEIEKLYYGMNPKKRTIIYSVNFVLVKWKIQKKNCLFALQLNSNNENAHALLEMIKG